MAPRITRPTRKRPAPFTHGGAREGAGRKPKPEAERAAAFLNIRMTADLRAALDAYAAGKGLTTSAAVVALITRATRKAA